MQRILFATLGATPGCAHLHVTRLKEAQVTAPHAQDFFEVFLVLEGQAMHHLNHQKIALSPGHLAVVRPQDHHSYSTEQGPGLVFVNVAVSAVWWSAFHTLLGLPNWVDDHRSAVLNSGDTQRLGAELSGTGLLNNPLAVVRAWSLVREHLTAPPRQRDNLPPVWLESVRRELAAKPEALVEPIAYWQRRSGRSPEHLARSCRRFYGFTFSELINRARIERARYLLRTTDEKVITIAIDCGFENMANFHRVFARLTGRTPGSWRSGGTAAVPIAPSVWESAAAKSVRIL